MIAQAGATFKHLAAHPRNSPAAPSVLQMWYKKRGIERSSGGMNGLVLLDGIDVDFASPE